MIRSQFIELWNGGIPIKEIAATCGCSKSSAQRLAYTLGLSPRGKGRKKLDREPLKPELQRLWLEGVSVARISSTLRISRDEVLRLASEMELPKRKRGRQSKLEIVST